MDPQIVPVIGQKFLEARACHIGELDLGFLGSDGRLAALDDVLFAGASGLNHLIEGAISALEKALAKMDGEVVNDLRLLVGEQLAVVTVWGEEASVHGRVCFIGPMGPMGPMGLMGLMKWEWGRCKLLESSWCAILAVAV